MALGRADPALLRQHHGHRLGGHQIGFVQGLRGIALHQRRATGVAELLGVGGQLVLDQLLELGLGFQDGLQLFAFGGQFVLLAADFHFLQPRQLAQLGVEDVVGLILGQLEPRNQRGLGLILGADDADDLVQVEERDQQAFQQVQAAIDLLQPVLEPAGDGFVAEAEPFGQQHLQVLDLRTPVQADDVEVDPVALFQVGGGEQMAHQLFDVDPVGTRNQHHPHRVGVIGFVADVLQPGQLLGAHLGGDLFDHLRGRDLVGQGVDDQVAVFPGVGGAGAHAAVAGFIHRPEIRQRRDDLRGGGIVRAMHVFAQVGDGGVRIIDQADARADDLVEVVRRHVGGHAHGDAGGAVEQQVRQTRRHPGRLFQGAVEVGRPVHRALAKLAQQHFGDRGQLGLGVAHGRERLGIVGRTEVALALDQRIAVRERLRHQHHRLVAGAVAVRVVLADDIADGARGLLRLGGGAEPLFTHRIDDPALHRLEAIADEGQGAVQHHVHRVVQVGAFGVLAQGDLFEAVEGGADGVAHRLRRSAGCSNRAILPVNGLIHAQKKRPRDAGPSWRSEWNSIAGGRCR